MRPAVAARIAERELTVDECADEYPHQWILLDVTEFDEFRHPLRGRVLVASPHHRTVARALSRFDVTGGTSGRLYFFVAEHYVRDGDTARQLIARAAESDSYECPTLSR